ncbi:LolA family protein [Phaeovulum sp. W22_SRMD_FR3]|uniref:LolA family protein n=1 Tax=Phaeovulum sp. W22_SRMD_FR3 TaxID=3240274 RepID=UPI003F9D2D77
MMMMRFFSPAALLAPLLALLLALPAAAADKIPLTEISRYLNGLGTVSADFTQVNSDGSQTAGKLFIRRPGRMRFEYAADKTLVLASGGQVAIFDAKSNQPPEQYPLARTPLNLILAPKIDLGRNKMVMGHVTDGTLTAVTAQDPDHPEVGSIQLIFSAAPTMLRQWVVTDDTGAQTRVSLTNLQAGETFPPSLFSITDEAAKRGF